MTTFRKCLNKSDVIAKLEVQENSSSLWTHACLYSKYAQQASSCSYYAAIWIHSCGFGFCPSWFCGREFPCECVEVSQLPPAPHVDVCLGHALKRASAWLSGFQSRVNKAISETRKNEAKKRLTSKTTCSAGRQVLDFAALKRKRTRNLYIYKVKATEAARVGGWRKGGLDAR